MLQNAVNEIETEKLFNFVDWIFTLCQELSAEHTSAVLDVILTLGKRIVDRDETEDRQYINYFEKKAY